MLAKIKPTSGFSYFFHLLLVLIIPIAVYILVTLNFIQLALSIIVLSKWRMFAVKPRFWAANIRANAVDLMVGISIVAFMTQTDSSLIRLLWVTIYGFWLLVIKPSSNIPIVTTQAFIAQLFALMALYLVWANAPLYALTILTGLFCYLAARHFLDAFEEPYSRLLAFSWAYFGGALAWLFSHWLLYYHRISLPAILLSSLGYGLALLYYLDHFDKLTLLLKRQIIFVIFAVVIVLLLFSDWGDKLV
ncbi:MAG TPA: hypothetical protein VLF63_02630 [Patescibacteria group bacterium]|nr:hypothetical protein [Patescibacteria group bacterium]